jgi:hypothetical protein
LADVPEDVRPEELGAALAELNWYRWDENAPEEGWVLRLAVEDRERGWSAALGASDVLGEEEA